MATATRLTTEEFLAREWPRYAELVEGEVVVNEPRWKHQELMFRVATPLRAWVAEAPGRGYASGSLDVHMGEGNVFGPDVLWVPEPAWRELHDGRDSARPALAVEFRSPSTWRYDLGAKKAAYEREGLPELWLVDDVAEAVLVYRRSAPGSPAFDVALELRRGESLASPLLSGFALALDALFAPA